MKTECVKSDWIDWEIGPYHAALPGPMGLALVLDGERIVSAKTETGFLHRGLEKAIEKHAWSAAIPYVDHLDPEAAAFAELALCLAVEEVAAIEVPARARAIRSVLCEISRISSHLLYVIKVARSTGADTQAHHVMRDRERVLDLFELLCGARFSLCYLRFGGVAADVTDGFVERVLEFCEMIHRRLKEYNDLFSFNAAFMRRSVGVGVLDAGLVRRFGVTGPNAKAAARGGDVHERFVVRLQEISESVGRLRSAVEKIPPGDYGLSRGKQVSRVPSGEAYSRVEGPRGELGCHLISDGGPQPNRVQFSVPSSAALQAAPEVLAGAMLEDLPMVLASLDLSLAEVDR